MRIAIKFFMLYDYPVFERRQMRICSNCNLSKTYINRKQKKPYEVWYRYQGKWICKKCHTKLITNPKWHSINRPRQLVWTPAHKQIFLKQNPRKGVCQRCHRKIGQGIKKTAIHHIQYHEDDPLKDTIELCVSCHMKEHKLWKY